MKALLIIIFSILTLHIFAGDGTWVKITPITALTNGQYTLFEPQRNSGEDTRSYNKLRAFVRLNYTRKLQSDRSHNYDWNVTVNFNYLVNGVSTAGSVTVNNELASQVYEDYLEIQLPDAALGYGITVTSVTGTYGNFGAGASTTVATPQTSAYIPDDIDLILELRSERVYNLNTTAVVDDISRVTFVPADFKLYWSYQQGAEEYDLEWVFVDKYSPEYTQITAAESGYTANEITGFSLPFELLEPTRVRVWGFNYQLDKAYPEGRLYFRVRAVSTFADQANGISDDIRYGKWGYYVPSTQLTLCKYEIGSAQELETNKTWLYGISYADDGKSVSTLTYFDGSNRGRQNLTYNTSDHVTLVGESKYDKEGRQTVSVVPAPIAGRNLLYQSSFNMAASGNVFDEGEIEQAVVPPLATISGSAKYFSSDNNFTGDLFRDAIPNAKGYVFSQTIFRNDGTGRIERVGGIGSDFQANGTHAARTWYGSTTAAELKRLFGDNVSDYPQGYRKDMVRDANGQLSVTYYDKRGNTIATALAGDAPTSLRKLDYQEETISTPLNDNNVQIGNSMISEHTFLNTIPGSTISLDYNLETVAQQIAAQTIEIEGHQIPLAQFCADCAYTLRIEVKNQYGVIIGTPVEAAIQPGGGCTPINYSKTGYTVTLPEIGEYRIIKTLSVDEQSMIESFQNQLNTQGSSSYNTFLEHYLSQVDITACFTDCEEMCLNSVKIDYIQQHGEAAWDTLNIIEVRALIAGCIAMECGVEDHSTEQPLEVNLDDACKTQEKRMLHQFSPGGVYYDDPNSYLWQSIGSGYGNYSLAQYQDRENFTPEMAQALLPIHRENCMLQDGRCQAWMSVQNSGFGLNLAMMQATWAPSGIFAAPWNSDPAQSAFGMGSDLQIAVNNFVSNHPITRPSDACDESSTLISPVGTNLYDYVDFFGNYVVALRQCSGISYTPDQVKNLKKQLYFGFYMKIKWDLVRAKCGCVLENNQFAVFMIPSDQTSMDAIINSALASVATAQSCEQVAINNVNHWMNALPASCIAALGMTGFTPILYPSTEAAGMQTAYGNGASTNIAQLFYNYTMASCNATPNPNTFGQFYDPGAGKPGKTWYDAIRSALAVAGCDYTTGMLPFETSAPTSPAIAYSNYNPLDLKEAIENLTFQILNCTSCPEVPRDENQSGVTKYMRVKQMTGVTIGMPAGYSGSVRVVKMWKSIPGGGVNTTEGYRYYFDMTITNGTCTFTLPINYQSPLGHDGSAYVFAGNFFFRMNTPVVAPDVTWIGTIVEDYLDITVNTSPNLTMKWDHLVGTFNGQSTQYLTTGITSDCAGTANVGFDLGSAYENLQDLIFNQTNDCIQSQLLQAEADAQVMYNQVIENLWSDFYAKMKLCLSAREDFRMSYKLKEYQYTLYYYDLAGNLVQTVPPQGVKPFSQAQVDNCLLLDNTPSFPSHEMETRYMYNGLNVLIASYTPDGGRTDLYLDKLYRVRFSQNAQQVQDYRVSYSKYDELGRVVEAGEFRKGNNTILSEWVDNQNYPSVGSIMDFTRTFYESGYIPPSTAIGYPLYPSTNPPDGLLNSAFGTGGQQNLRNAIGAVMHRQADYSALGIMTPGTEVITVISYSYDAHKNVKRVVHTNYQLADIGQQHKVTDYKYDLISGNVEEVAYQKGKTDEYRHRYSYDANNRLVRSYTSHNGDYWELDAKYFYYLHGSLARRELGHDQVQGTDYAYNLQGWLKGVNSSTLDRTRDIGKDGNTGTDNQYFGVDAFGFSLGYFDWDYQAIKDATESPQNYLNDYFALSIDAAALNENPDSHAANASMSSLYNGNITHMVTAIRDKNEAKLDILLNNYQYDQLQRIREMKVYTSTIAQSANFIGEEATLFRGAGGESAFQESYTFDKNGNLRTLKRNGSGWNDLNGNGIFDPGEGIALAMDNFTYRYHTMAGPTVIDPTTSNRLANVIESVPTTTNYEDDIEPNPGSSYQYNKNGQLLSDAHAYIQQIDWTVTGKVKKITYTDAGKTIGKRDVKFIYDPMDRRVAKLLYVKTDNTEIKWTYYSYDAGGNVLATYNRTRRLNSSDATYNYYSDSYSINDHLVYGVSRLGSEQENLMLVNKGFKQLKTGNSTNVELRQNWTSNPPDLFLPISDYTRRTVGDKRYELSNHLGNVLEVISDRKVRFTDNGTLVYAADVVSYADYSPYGTLLGGRHGDDNNYRYGFQGQERDDEIKGAGNSYNYEYRMHDPRIGRFFAVDPLAPIYSYNSPYAFSENRVIDSKELEGLENVFAADGSWLAYVSGLPAGNYRLNSDAIKKHVQNANYKEVRHLVTKYRQHYEYDIKMILDGSHLWDPNRLERFSPGLKALSKATTLSDGTPDNIKLTKLNIQNLVTAGHTILDGVGLIPVVGEPADGINAVWYALEGNYTDAALSGMAMIPIVGWGATSSKWVRNVLKFSDNAFHSATGLVFKTGSKHGNRLSHVLEHTTNDLSKAYHGVFDSKEEVVSLMDEAWGIAQKGGDDVVKKTEDGRDIFIVNMNRRVGYQGGSKGSGKGLSEIKIVVESGTSNVITIFPN